MAGSLQFFDIFFQVLIGRFEGGVVPVERIILANQLVDPLLTLLQLMGEVGDDVPLLVGLVVTGHLLRGGGRVLKNLQLRLGVVLEVFAVSEDLAGFHKGDRLAKAFLLPNLRVLHPWLKHLP